MRLQFNMLDLLTAFKEYSEESIQNIDELTEELKKENFLYLKAIHEFIFWFSDDYINDVVFDRFQSDLNNVYEHYKHYYSKLYDVIAYGQECDASTADPVTLKGIMAADEEELSEKVRKRAWKEGCIYNLVHYDIINKEDSEHEHEQET